MQGYLTVSLIFCAATQRQIADAGIILPEGHPRQRKNSLRRFFRQRTKQETIADQCPRTELIGALNRPPYERPVVAPAAQPAARRLCGDAATPRHGRAARRDRRRTPA